MMDRNNLHGRDWVGCAWVIICVIVAVPVGLIFYAALSSGPAPQPVSEREFRELKRAVEKRSREAKQIEKLRLEREGKLKAVGAENVNPLDTSSVDAARKQMRIEGLDPSKDIVTFFKDANARIDAQSPLKVASKAAKFGRVEGEVLMLDELAGVKKGDLIDDVMQRFDAPNHRGFTNDVHHFSQAWPDMNYYSYESADVTFLTYAGRVELILVGLTYREARRP